MFVGTFAPRLDDKGRLILPAKWREELADGLVIVKGQERCLYVYPEAEFRLITQAMREAPQADRARSRLLFASAHDETPDRQGRVTVPQSLREYAALDRECTVIGNNNRLEIWNPQAWDRYVAENEPRYASLPETGIPGF